MKPNPGILEIVAKGYMMGWLRPPAPQVDAYKIHRQQEINEAKRRRAELKSTEPKPVA